MKPNIHKPNIYNCLLDFIIVQYHLTFYFSLEVGLRCAQPNLHKINFSFKKFLQQMQYRRATVEGGTYFFTLVTYHRQRLFDLPSNVSLLRNAFRHVMEQHPFIIDAFVLLPDHLHCIWTLPQGDV
uniref:REP-associated tyrosine transposase n=1 Tax=Nostoc paludosum TaxID=212362 RepID=UPI0028C4510B|nr:MULTISPECIES: hypothetical protein [Nostoc]